MAKQVRHKSTLVFLPLRQSDLTLAGVKANFPSVNIDDYEIVDVKSDDPLPSAFPAKEPKAPPMAAEEKEELLTWLKENKTAIAAKVSETPKEVL